jgi:hypothetical protein
MGRTSLHGNRLNWTDLTILKILKIPELSVDSRREAANLEIPLKGGTYSISGVGVLLWPGKPILCSR